MAQYSKLCKEIGEPEAGVALAWLLHNPAVASPAVGPRTVEQLDKLVRAVDEIVLSEDVLEKLDKIFPPAGQSPEAYAW